MTESPHREKYRNFTVYREKAGNFGRTHFTKACRTEIKNTSLIHGTCDLIEMIDKRILAFTCADVSPCNVVCPCCGYPCMDCDEDGISSCDICGWPVWQILHNRRFPQDAIDTCEGLSLQQCRLNFLTHGDAWPLDHADNFDNDIDISFLRKTERQALARQCMLEWDAWLENPNLKVIPIPVWQRLRLLEKSLQQSEAQSPTRPADRRLR